MSIVLGGLNSGARTISGLSSGLDSEAIIKAAVSAKSKPVNDLVIEQSSNNAKIAALKSLKGILSSLGELSNGLRNPLGFNQQDKNAFLYRNPVVTGNPTAFDTASDMIRVTANPGAQIANYTIEITNLAQKEIETIAGFSSQTADLTDGGTPEVVAGTFQINGENITIASGATLNDIRVAINAKSSDTGVTASIITITPESANGADDGVYQLQLVSNETGAANSISFTNFTTVFPGSGGVTVTQDQAALDASIEFNGTTITRSSNTIDDIITGVTFELLNAEAGTELTVDITQDTSTASSQIQNFIANINQFLIFSSNQQARDPGTGEPLPTAFLFDSPLLKTINSSVQTILKSSISTISGAYNDITDLGYSQELFEGEQIDGNPNTPSTSLLTEDGSLGTKLINNFDDIKQLFELQFNATGANDILALASTTRSISLTNFTVTVDTSQAEGQRVLITPSVGSAFYAEFDPYDDNDLSAGGTIIGVDGTALAGARFVYTGDGTDTISATISEGLGQKFYNLVQDQVSSLGSIDDQILLLQERNDDIDTEVADLQEEINDFELTLRDRYAQLEAAIAEANGVLSFLTAFQAAQNKG